MAHKVLSDDDINAALEYTDGWVVEDGKLFKTYVFDDFVTAFAFMTRCAEVAEAAGHHPEWFNVYKTVKVWFVTHDVDPGPAITDTDIRLARRFDTLV